MNVTLDIHMDMNLHSIPCITSLIARCSLLARAGCAIGKPEHLAPASCALDAHFLLQESWWDSRNHRTWSRTSFEDRS